MTKFANLPDDCYFLIFARLSTSTLLSCRRVSRAWLRNQQDVCRHRKVLILLQGNSPTKLLTNSHFKAAFISHGIDQNGQPMDFDQFLLHNRVNLLSFNQNVTQFLAETFPNLDTLIIVQNGIYICQAVIEPLIGLLQKYFSKVVTLKMYLNYRYVGKKKTSVVKANILNVIRQLNSMTALEHVTLESQNPLSFQMTDKDLEFLSRIKQFYCYSPNISLEWFDALRRLEQTGNVSQLEQIGLGNNQWAPRQPFDHWPLENRFTHLPFSIGQLEHYAQLIALFPALTSFTFEHFCGRRDFAQRRSLANKLNALSQHCTQSLVHVKIAFSSETRFAQPFDPTTIKPLESVKALDLVFPCHKYYNHFCTIQINPTTLVRPVVHTFPNLASIKIIVSHYSKQNFRVECANFFRLIKVAFERESLQTDLCEQSL